MATEKRPTMLRLPEEIYEKVRYLAFVERRSVNIADRTCSNPIYIADYENRHGPIQLPETSQGE